MRRKNWFDIRFELLGSKIGRNSGKINSSADLPHLPSPPGSAQIRAGRVVEKSFKILPWRSETTWFLLPGPSITIRKYHLTGLALTTAMKTHKMRTDLIILVLRFVNTRLAEFCKKKKKNGLINDFAYDLDLDLDYRDVRVFWVFSVFFLLRADLIHTFFR